MLVYLDQNILGYAHKQLFQIPVFPNVTWVYSSEHFDEISRGECESLLSILDEIGARRIEILDPATDKACLHEVSPAATEYKKYQVAIGDIQVDDPLLLEILTRLFGADNEKAIDALPQTFRKQLEDLLTPHLPADVVTNIAKAASELAAQIAEQLDRRTSLNEIRKVFGTDKGQIGNVSRGNVIPEIWGLIGKNLPQVSTEQFFGFEPIDESGPEPPSAYLGIVGCHTVLNLVGYRPDKGLRSARKMRNALSDGIHIGHPAFCDALISADQNLCSKALAIYGFRNVGTQVLRLELRTT